MGTSGTYPGGSGRNPLLPSWLDAEATTPVLPDAPNGDASGPPEIELPSMSETEQPPVATSPERLRDARSLYSRYARSGGSDQKKLKRSLSKYVRTGVGGATTAGQRMRTSTVVASKLAGFLAQVRDVGTAAALTTWNLGSFVGKHLSEIMPALLDRICPTGGTINEGIARNAFVDAIIEFSQHNTETLDNLSGDDLTLLLELFVCRSIMGRIENDIGNNAIPYAPKAEDCADIESGLYDFVYRSVEDAFQEQRFDIDGIPENQIFRIMERIYTNVFSILSDIGAAEVPEP